MLLWLKSMGVVNPPDSRNCALPAKKINLKQNQISRYVAAMCSQYLFFRGWVSIPPICRLMQKLSIERIRKQEKVFGWPGFTVCFRHLLMVKNMLSVVSMSPVKIHNAADILIPSFLKIRYFPVLPVFIRI